MTNEAWLQASQLAMLIGAVLLAVGTYGAFTFSNRIQNEKEARAAYAGTLHPKNRAVLVSGREGAWPKVLEIGDSGTLLRFEGPEGAPLLQIGRETSLTIVREDGEVKVSTTVRDKAGVVLAELVKNEWRVNPARTWDRNYSADALEVRDPTGDIILQVKVLPDRIQLQGKFYAGMGRRVGIGKLPRSTKTGVSSIEITGKAHPELKLHIEPMFRYPSSQHLGELAREKR